MAWQSHYLSECWYSSPMRRWASVSYALKIWGGDGGGGGGGGCGFSVGFRIGMLITARWLETLQRAKKGVRNNTFCLFFFFFFFTKIGVEIRHFPHVCPNIGIETIQIFQRPQKGGSKWRSICSNHHIVSTLPECVFCNKVLRDLMLLSQRHI